MLKFASKTIRSWDKFNKFVLGMNSSAPAQNRSWLYRGQSFDWPLTTTIERALYHWGIDLKKATYIEFQSIREFRRRVRDPEHHRVHCDTLFCLALMQHHGAPTRLLDCTYSPYAAAAFAIEDGIVSKKPVIWCFRAEWCENEAMRVTPDNLVERRNDDSQRNDQTFIPLFQLARAPKGPTKWKFVKHDNPLHLNERLTTQQGIFLCPADLASSFVENLKAMQDWHSDQNVVKLRLDLRLAEAQNFARNLKSMNLSYAALFPGLDGFSRSIGQQIVHYEELADSGAGATRMRR
jgi:FRG domain-containing protein